MLNCESTKILQSPIDTSSEFVHRHVWVLCGAGMVEYQYTASPPQYFIMLLIRSSDVLIEYREATPPPQ